MSTKELIVDELMQIQSQVLGLKPSMSETDRYIRLNAFVRVLMGVVDHEMAGMPVPGKQWLTSVARYPDSFVLVAGIVEEPPNYPSDKSMYREVLQLLESAVVEYRARAREGVLPWAFVTMSTAAALQEQGWTTSDGLRFNHPYYGECSCDEAVFIALGASVRRGTL